MSWLGVAALIAGLLFAPPAAGGKPHLSAQPGAAASAQPGAAASVQPGAAASAQADVLAMARRIAPEVATLRRLPLRKPLDVGVYTRPALRKLAEAELKRGDAKRRMAGTTRLWQALGVADVDADLLAATLSLLEEQVAGFYDPRTGKLRLMSQVLQPPKGLLSQAWRLISPPSDETIGFVLAHEIIHALQDQHFGIAGLADGLAHESDLSTATLALIEGDAMVGGLAWMLAQRGTDVDALWLLGDTMRKTMGWMVKLLGTGLIPDTAALRRAPPLLRESLLFPYLGGLPMCLDVGLRGLSSPGGKTLRGWRAVDALYRKPPVSTEQVLHPEKLLGPQRDDPVALELRKLGKLTTGYRAIWHDSLGELYIRALLRALLPPALDADEAAAGWDGDRVVLLAPRKKRSGQRDAILWLSTWDSERDAADFAHAIGRALPDGMAWRGGVGGRDVLFARGLPRERFLEAAPGVVKRAHRRARSTVPGWRPKRR